MVNEAHDSNDSYWYLIKWAGVTFTIGSNERVSKGVNGLNI